MLGADVVKVESPDRPDEARAAATGGDRFLHAQKRSLALDVASADGGDAARTPASPTPTSCSTTAPSGRRRHVRARYDELLAAHRRLVIASFSTYGLDGPRAGWLATELTELAAGGLLAVRPARRSGGHARRRRAAAARSAPSVRSASLLALTARRRDGRGQLVEVAAQEALIHMLTLPTVVYSFSGVEHAADRRRLPVRDLPVRRRLPRRATSSPRATGPGCAA